MNKFTASAQKAQREAQERGPVTWVVTFAIIDGRPWQGREEYVAQRRYEAEDQFKDARGGWQAHNFRNVQIVEKSLIAQNEETNRRNGY